jgi:hypothetical protein
VRIKELQIKRAGALCLVTVVATETLRKVVGIACGAESDNNNDGDGGTGR